MRMYYHVALLMVAVLLFSALQLDAQVQMNFDFETPYGNNEQLGKYAEVNGAQIYYEEYGEGEALLLIHGNGADIKSMGNQIDYFKTHYRVIVADSRGHGKSELNTDSLTYVQIAEDWLALVGHMELDSFYIIGWSDGGNVGLLMGIDQDSRIKKLVSMGANLRPDSTAIYAWKYDAWEKKQKNAKIMIEKGDTSENWDFMLQRLNMMLYQPQISHSDLRKIRCPVLIMAGDKDLIRLEHSVEIFQNIPKAHLCIMPGETHYTPASNPDYFNQIAEKFITDPYIRLDSDLSKQ
jgi:pimeloyl-ACP methyl ester carboxylesterase